MAVFEGMIAPLLIDEHNRTQSGIYLGKGQPELAQNAAGPRTYIVQPASYENNKDHIQGERQYVTPRGEYLDDKIFEVEKKIPIPRQTPLEVSWKKAVFSES
jgi:hypothetical protein